MVYWCNNCGAFLGLREPLADWKTNWNACCQYCASSQFGLAHVEMEGMRDMSDLLPNDTQPVFAIHNEFGLE